MNLRFGSGKRRWLPRACLIALALGLLGVFFQGASRAPSAGSPSIDLPPLAHPAVPSTPRNANLDSSLAAVDAKTKAAGKDAGIAFARANGLTVAGGRVRVVVEASTLAAAATAVQLHGGTVEATYAGNTQAIVPPGEMAALAASNGVRYVRPPFQPEPDLVVDEGVAVTNASAWQALGRTGAGVNVAIVDLGFNGYAAAQASGELPASLTAVDYCGGDINTATEHGTAVAEIVHQMAPGAQLYLICVDSDVTLGQAEEYVKSHGITIVNHSVGWFNTSRGDGSGGPGTPDAIVADALANGILWVNCAGNAAQDHWSGNWSSPDGDDWENFTSTNEGNFFYLDAGDSTCVMLKWDSWPTTSQDYDLLIGNPDLNPPWVAGSVNTQDGSQPPTEKACYTNTTGSGHAFLVAINRNSATGSPRFDLFFTGSEQSLQYQVAAGSIPEPATSPAAFAVGAIEFTGKTIEPFSSRGPTIDNRIKPDISGPDGTSSAVYTTGFYGTSAASPHVAGAAALVEGLHPTWSVSQVEAFLTASAIPLGAAGKDNIFGAGYLYLPLTVPKVTSFAPLAAPVGATVTITGTGLAGVTEVDFGGGVPAAPTTATATSLKVVIPAGATTGTLHVVSPDGTFTTTVALKVTPKITGFTPTSDIRGHSVEIDGYNFSGATKVAFGTVAVPPLGYTVVSPNEIDATIPNTAVTGKITVTTPAGSGTSADTFTVILPPTVTSFTPAAAAVGSAVTVTGTNLGSVTTVTLNGADVGALVHVGTTQVKFTVPTPAHTGFIEVTNPGGSAHKTPAFKVSPTVSGITVGIRSYGMRGEVANIAGYNFTGATKVTFGTVPASPIIPVSDNALQVPIPATAITNKVTVTTPDGSGTSTSMFTVVLPPKVTSFTPASGPVGTVVTVNGSSLDCATSAALATVDVGAITHVTATQIRFTVPAHTSTGFIAVTNPAGDVASTTQFKVTPKITGFTSVAPVGDTIEIDGSNFTGATAVKFGAVAVATGHFSVDTDSVISAEVPATAVSGKITVTTPAGSGTSTGSFTVMLRPTVTNFTPASGPVGTTVTVTGTSLAWVSSASIGSVDVGAVTVLSPTQIRFVVPAGASTNIISVQSPAGHGGSVATFKVTPKITGLNPSSGPRGNAIEIDGYNFTGATAVKFGTVAVPVGSFSVDSDTVMHATVPPTAVTSTVTVTTPAGSGTSATQFTVILPPTITGFSPASGPVGTTITVNGTNLDSVWIVFIGSVSSMAITHTGSTQIQFPVPMGASTGTIQVSNPASDAQTSTTFKVTPRIAGFTPASAAPGVTIEIHGYNFTGATAVSFAGVAATDFSVVNDETITVVVPALADTGAVTVTTPSGSGTSSTDFTVL